MPDKNRCPWAKDEYEIAYHDNEWCKEEHDDAKLFEMLILEGMQAGLSWRIILHKREAMRRAFDGFDPNRIRQYDEAKLEALRQDASIIRNKAKLNALVSNARAFLAVQEEFGSFDAYVWRFVGGKQQHSRLKTPDETPATSPISDALSKDLKKRGFKFVGSTICYSYMQAVGMVNDHIESCDFCGAGGESGA